MSKAVKIASALILFVTLTVIAVVGSLRPGFVWQTVGSCCGLLALTLALAAAARAYTAAQGGGTTLLGRPVALADGLRRSLPALLVVAVAVGVLAPLLLGQMPLSHDHPVHLYKSWHFFEEMLLRGRLRGWSSFWFFGYPAEELYPIGPDLWVALFRLVTLGALSWEATYGLAFVGVFAFAAYAVYSFGRRHFGATAGVVAALCWTLDMGDYREGGWSYTVDWAVWVQVLAMAFALVALGRLHQVLERGRPRDYALCGLLFAAALLSHPMNVMVFAIALPLLLLSRALAEGQPLGREIAATGGTLAIGVALAGFWFLPMLARSAWTTDIGDLWRPLGPTVKGLLDGTVFANVWPVVIMLAIAGAAVGVALRRATAVFLLSLAAVLLFVASSTAFEELSLITVSKAFAKIQYQRLTIPAKACLYLLGGFAVSELAARVSAWRSQRAEGLTPAPTLSLIRRAGLALLLAGVLCPFVRPALKEMQQSYLRTVGGLVLQRSIPYWEDYQEFLRWSAQKRATGDKFFRISYELDRHNHLMMGAPARNHVPYYKVGYTPARLFKHVTETIEEPMYQVLSVAYVVSLGPLARPNLRQEIRFGSIFVYRYTDYRSERYTLTGPGRVKEEAFGEEKIRLRLSGTGPGSRLKVHVSNYPRWRARMNGKGVPIVEAPVYGTSYPMLMEVPVEDGELAFDYVMRGPDWAGALASLFGLGAVTLLLLAQRREKLAGLLAARLGFAGRLAARYAAWVALGAALLLLGLVVFRVARGGSGLDDTSLARLLPGARVTQAGHPCTERRGKAWHCSGRSWNYVGPAAEKFNGAYLPCIWAHPVDQGPLVIRFPKTLMGRAIVGHHGIADGAVEGFVGGASVRLEIQIDGKPVETVVRPNEKGWAGFRVDTSAYSGREVELALAITTASAGGRHYCFDARIEP